jgi:hypothetical protein
VSGSFCCLQLQSANRRSCPSQILAVAIPKITDEFKRLNHVGWYAASYLLSSCGEHTPDYIRGTYLTSPYSFPVALWQTIHPVWRQTGVFDCPVSIRAWVPALRARSILFGPHHGPYRGWNWLIRDIRGLVRHTCTYSSVEPSSAVHWHYRRCFWPCLSCWSSGKNI